MIALATNRLTPEQQALVESHLPLAKMMVRKLCKQCPSLDKDEVIGIANLALVRAVIHCRNRQALAKMVMVCIERAIQMHQRGLQRDERRQREAARPVTIENADVLVVDADEEVRHTMRAAGLTVKERRLMWNWARQAYRPVAVRKNGPLGKQIIALLAKLQRRGE